ncbi:MAG TPA: hypothetical protein DEQ26_12735, partial [Flavobacteriaceae bacterium]|nr:hypothetical protein [Flavobacteriaceae bacterium]
MKTKVFFASALFALTLQQASAQYISTDQFANPTGVSITGLVVGNQGYAQPNLIWSPDASTIEVIGGITAGSGHGGRAVFSGNGTFISGVTESQIDPTKGEMSRYNLVTKEWKKLGNSSANNNGFTSDYSNAFGISKDGKTVGGMSFNASYVAVGYIWNENKGGMSLESMNPTRNSRVNAVSNDGSVVVGYQDYNSSWKASVWTRKADGTYNINKILLIDPKGDEKDSYNQLGQANAISGDGKWIGGNSDYAFENAWIWSEETGVQDLGNFASVPNTTKKSYVNSINNDGSVVLGFIQTLDSQMNVLNYEPFIWIRGKGLFELNDYIKNTLGYNMGNDKINSPIAISSNMKYIVGWGSNNGQPKVMRIQLPNNFLSTQQQEVKTNEVKLYPNPVT